MEWGRMERREGVAEEIKGSCIESVHQGKEAEVLREREVWRGREGSMGREM